MNFKNKANLVPFFMGGLMIFALPSFADTETTTVRTTSITSNNPDVVTSTAEFVLPATSKYVLFDPVTGNVKGNYDPLRGLTDTQLLRSGLVVVNQDTGKIIATIDASGRPIDVVSAPAFDSLIVAIDTRRSDLERIIADGLSKGTISPQQASLLRVDLNKIQAEEVSAKQSRGVLTYSEAMSLALALNNLGDRLMPYNQATPFMPLLGSRIVSTNGQLLMVDEVEYRKVQLLQRMDDEYTAGRLSAQQVASLKDQLNAVSALETKYKKNGEMSESSTKKISIKLDNLKTKLDQDVAIINDKRSKIGLRVE